MRKDLDGRRVKSNRQARLRAMRKQYDEVNDVFRCHYTGIRLDGDKGSRRYATWEHLTPRNQSSVALAADLVNKMKANLTDDEFRVMVRALAASFDEGTFEESRFPADP